MRKNTGKVLSMILAMAMVVSSFSATFVSASTQEVVGNGARVDTIDGTSDDEYHLVSSKYEDLVIIDDLDDAFSVQTMDRETLDDVEYVSFTKKSGDSLVKVVKDEDDNRNLVLKKNSSGTETIVINYKGTYTDDDTDKEITARGSIEIDITANVEGTVILGKYTEGKNQITGDEPDDPELAAVNDSAMKLAFYIASNDGTSPKAIYDVTAAAPEYADDNDTDDSLLDYVKLSSDKNFVMKGDEDADQYEEVSNYTNDVITLVLRKNDKEGSGDNAQYDAKVFTTKLEAYGPKVTVDRDGVTVDSTSKGDKYKASVGADKKWRVTEDSQIDKVGARTVIGRGGNTSFDSDSKYSDIENDVKIVTGYDIVVDSGSLTVNGGTLKSINAADAKDENGDTYYSTLIIENANISGDVKSKGNITIGEDASVGGTIKSVAANYEINIEDGAKASAIDAENAILRVDGGSVSGNVTVAEFYVSDNDEYGATFGGDVKADKFDVEATDGSFNVKGSMVLTDASGTYDFEGNNIAVGAIDADYFETTVNFDDVDLAVSFKNAADATVQLTSESDITVNGASYVGYLDVEEDSVLRFTDTTTVEELSGDGMVVAPAGQLHIRGGISDVQLKLTDLAIGATAFTASADAVSQSDFNPIGYTLKRESVNSTTDKFTVDAVSFAGLAFDKEFVTIAKGYSDTITLAAYPTGTTAPADAKVMWELDGNDDYFNVVVDPNTNVATINVTDYNADDVGANTATIRAYLVDEDGYELEGYVAATCKVTAIAQPEVKGTLKADTTSYTMPVGGIYDILFTVSGVDATPVVTDSRTGSIFQLTDLGNGKYRVTGVNEGTAYVVATVGDTRVSVAITVDNDATQGGVKGNNVSEIR